MLQLTGVLDGGDTSAKVGTRYGPAGLSDPDPLAGRDTVDLILGGLDRVPEYLTCVGDLRALKIGITDGGVSWKICQLSV